MRSRTFKVQSPHMEGSDVREFQRELRDVFRSWEVDYPLAIDGDYGVATRAAASDALKGLGILQKRMAGGVTPELRTKIRHRKTRRTPAELWRAARRRGWRRKLRAKHAGRDRVAPPLNRVIADSWGWHPGVHDGIDLICPPNATLFALCDARVIDVRTGGWWGKAPSGDVTKGDGIIQLECLVNAGPFRRGMHFGYGHAEHPLVRVGQVVKAGEPIGRAGLAVAWHVHFMVNGGGTTRGVGDRDPRPFYEFAMRSR